MRRTLEMIGCALWGAFVFVCSTAAILVLPIWALSACAQDVGDTRWALREYRRCEHRDWQGRCVWYSRGHYFYSPSYRTYRRAHPRNHAYYRPEREPTRVYSYERRRDRDDDREYGGGVECKGQSLRVTGDDKLQENNAEISAQERWALEVENRYGTLYSDVRYAKNMRVTCIRKVPASVTERGQAALGVRHHICTVTAIACAAPAVRVDDESRAKRRSEKIDDDRTPPSPRRDR